MEKREFELVPVEELKEGDLIDLESCPFLYKHPRAAFEYATVEAIEIETDDCTAVYYLDFDCVGYDHGTLLKRAIVSVS